MRYAFALLLTGCSAAFQQSVVPHPKPEQVILKPPVEHVSSGFKATPGLTGYFPSQLRWGDGVDKKKTLIYANAIEPSEPWPRNEDLIAFDSETGQVVWRSAGIGRGHMAVSDGSLYLATKNGLHVFDAQNGKQ